MQDGSSHSLIGSELDKRYRILSPIGEGGMGAVFLGEHMRIGRQVAIKILNPALASSDDFLERFQREAIAAGRLDHPNCVPVTDSGHLDDGTAYLVMELVSGQSLGTVLENEGPRLSPLRALRIMRHVLRGLGHAHKVGIVHRDIKPDNIMLCEREDDTDFARVLDFGIAKLRDEDSKDKATLTQAGVAVGTPAYLSPEQALGDNIDLRSDIYSCSVVLFDMLCGRPPFEANNPIGILTKHASEDAPHLWELAPELEEYPALDELVQRGLAKERGDRFQDAVEFVEAIDKTLVQMGSILTPVPAVRAISELGQTGLAHRAQTAPPDRAQTAPPDRAQTDPSLLSHRAQTDPTQLGPELAERQNSIRRILIMAGTVLAAIIVVVIAAKSCGGSGTPPVIPGLNTEALLVEYQNQLRNGKTCKDRLEAVQKLRALGDKRAIPSLKKARRRMRGGVIGIGQNNSNRCLTKAAKKAIRELSGS